MVTKFGGVDPDKANLAAMLGSHGLKGIDVVLGLLFIGINKEVRQWPATGDIDIIRVTANSPRMGIVSSFSQFSKSSTSEEDTG